MAGERKENSVLFSLKELKDITADEPEQPLRSKAAPALSSASARRPSFMDDKDDLLADLRSSVAADAEAEAARIEAERRALRDAEDRRKHETATLQRAEIDARIAAEQARRRAAEDERVARARQIDLDERRARGEIIEEPAAAPEPVVHVTHVPAAVPQVLAPVQPQGRSTAFYLTVVGLPVVCITAIAIAVILTQKETNLQPVSTEPVVVNVQPAAVITASPTAPAIASAAPTEPPAPVSEAIAQTDKPRPKGPRGPKPGVGEKPGAGGEKPAKTPTGGLKIDLNSD